MKTFTKTLGLVLATFLLNLTIAHAQCSAGFTWSQTTNNVIDFTNTSTPIIPNSTNFIWSFGDNQNSYFQQNPSHTYSIPGSYVVCLTMYDSLSSCQAQYCDTIIVTGNVLCSLSMYVYQTQVASCSTCTDGGATAVPFSGTAPFTYLWSDGESTASANLLPPGMNTICVTDANGCQACDTVNIMFSNSSSCQAAFTFSQTQNNIIDFTSTSTGVSSGTYYSWTFGDNYSGYSNQTSHTYQNPGTYIVCLTIYDSLSACQSTFCDSVTVTGNYSCNVYTYASVSQSASCATCADGSGYAYMNNGTAPYTYAWSSGGNGQFENGLAPGVYTICITDAHGCNSCDTLTMTWGASNCSASFTWSQTYPNEIDFISTSTGITSQTWYYWSWGDNNSSFNNSSNTISHLYANTGTYYVCLTIYDSLNFCSSTYCDSVTVWGNVLPTVCDANFVIYPDSVNTNQAWAYNLSTGGPNMTYQWFWGDNSPVDVVPYPSHVYASTGTYNICLVVVDTANSCSDTMCLPLWVPRLSQQAAMAPYYVNVIPMGIREQIQTTFTLFPNPASTEIKIKSDYSLQGKQFSILDVTGRSVLSGTLSGTTIDVNSLDNGLYMLQIENSNGGFSAQRFMKD